MLSLHHTARYMWLAIALCPALLLAACGGGGPKELGDKCKADKEMPCEEGLVCAPDGEGQDRCQAELGSECDTGEDESYCVGEAVCAEVTVESGDGGMTTEGQCRLPEGAECDGEAEEAYCSPDLSCVEITDGTNACHVPLVLRGEVRDGTDESAIEGAHVIALDETKVAVTDVAVSDVMGMYELELPTVREPDGTPTTQSYTLRASADGYRTFPGGVRQALPISTSEAVDMEDAWVVQGTITDVVLIPLEDPDAARTTISGSIVAEENQAGVLVVAEGGSGEARSAISDLSGDYTIFNVTDGDYEVRGYTADLQLMPASVSVAGEPLVDVDLMETSEPPLATVSGSVNIVNAPGGSMTSVILVVESTFDETLVRGEVPAGLRAPREGDPNVTAAWSIEGVPAGDYVVLAAFENDDLVRDPDQLIAGTEIVRVTVPGDSGSEVVLDTSFKVTEALDVVQPGAETPEGVSSAPTLEWADDSSEELYEVVVYDSFGDLVWGPEMIDGVSGSDTVSVDYGGPLETGMYYQFRATSFRMPGSGEASAISTTEDLRGVFFGQ